MGKVTQGLRWSGSVKKCSEGDDETFTKFYPQCHQPLHVLLGKPVYLELRLRSPKPTATLLVHYCVAYPRSAKSALVLLFEE
ncbi:unnamed protein product [Leuciscus chuanchicus]